MPDKQVRIDLIASDKASDKVRDVADEVEQLEKASPEVEVTADTGRAETDLEAVQDQVQQLDRADAEVALTAKVDAARSDLKKLQADLKETRGDADNTRKALDDVGGTQGPRLAGNTVADLTGPLGEASGVAGDLGGVMDGLADITEAAMTKMGGSAAALAPQMATILGLGGLAIAGIGAAYTYFQQEAKKAKQRQQDLIEGQKELNDAIREGDSLRFAEQLTKDYEDAFKAADKLGVSEEELTKFITGQTDAVASLESQWITATAAAGKSAAGNDLAGQAAQRSGVLWLQQYDVLVKARSEYEKSSGALTDQKDRLDKVASATGIATDKADAFADAQERVKKQTDRTKDSMDRLRGSLNMERALLNFSEDFQAAHDAAIAGTKLTGDEILNLKEDILDVAEYAGLNPVEVKSLLDRIEAGDYLGVKTDVETMAKNNPPSVATQLETPSTLALSQWINSIQQRINAMGGRVYVPGGGVYQPSTGSSMAPAAVVNVTQNVPRGYHGADLIGDARRVAVRSGGLYHRNRR